MTCRSMGGACVMISKPQVGVCARTGPKGRRAAVGIAVKSLILVCCCAQFAICETGPDYSSVGSLHQGWLWAPCGANGSFDKVEE